MDDLISRRTAIKAFDTAKFDVGYCSEYGVGYNDGLDYAIDKLSVLPSAQSTLYGYSIEHLATIARVMERENCTPEAAAQMLQNAGEVAKMVRDEILEMLKEHW